MLAKRPIYNHKLQCVAFEILSEYQTEDIEAVKSSLIELITNSDIHLPLFIPYELKTIIEEHAVSYDGPIILKLAAEDIDTKYPQKELNHSMFSIALHITDLKQFSWINFAEYVAISEELMTKHQLINIIEFCREHQRKIIAYSLNEPLSFNQCKALHLDYYCGDFIFAPDEANNTEIASSKLNLLQLIQKLQHPNCDFNTLSDIIKKDPLLTYQLLKVANSAMFTGFQHIDSINQALRKMGLINIKNWVMVLSMKNISEKPIELIESALIRAHMTQTLAEKQNGVSSHAAYTTGLLSVLDGLLNKPMSELLETLTLSDEINLALIEKTGPLGDILTLVTHYEEGHWEKIVSNDYMGVDLSKLYIECMSLAASATKGLH